MTTIDERIRRMKQLVQEKQEAEQKARVAAEALRAAHCDRTMTLVEKLRPLVDLPLENGNEVMIAHVRLSETAFAVRVLRRHKLTRSLDSTPLMQFFIHLNESNGSIWIEHNDTKVSDDVALDLAVAAVERELDI